MPEVLSAIFLSTDMWSSSPLTLLRVFIWLSVPGTVRIRSATINLHSLLVFVFGTRVRCVKILAADEAIRRPPFLVFCVSWLHPHRWKNLLLQHLFGSSAHRQPMPQVVSCFSTAGRPTNMPLLTSMDRGSFRCKNSQPGWPNWSRGETSRSSSTATTG